MTSHACYLVFKQMNINDDAVHIIKAPAPEKLAWEGLKGKWNPVDTA